MTSEERYLRRRAAVLATAIGIARLKLRAGDPEAALAELDRACGETHRLLFNHLVESGHPDRAVELLVGRPVRANLTSSGETSRVPGEMSWSASITTSTDALADDLAAATASPPDLNETAERQFAAAKVAVAAFVAANVLADGPLYVAMSGHAHSGTDALDMISVSVSARPQPETAE